MPVCYSIDLHHMPGRHRDGVRQLPAAAVPRPGPRLPGRHLPGRLLQTLHPDDSARAGNHVLCTRGVQTQTGGRGRVPWADRGQLGTLD